MSAEPIKQHLAATPGPGLTWRAGIIGGLLVIFISIWSQYAELVIHGTQISLTYPPIGAFLVFIAFILLIQWPLLAIRRQLALTARELVIIWSMLSLAIGVASIDIAQKMPPMIAGPLYYASPENHYEDLFLPHIAKWLAPQDLAPVKGLFESSARGVPWDVWITPLVAWSLFFVVAYWVMLCGVALFQRQWVHHERLLYPLVVVPLEVLGRPERGHVFNQFFRNKLVWLGIALGMLPHLYTGLHDYFPKVPQADVFLWGKRIFQGGLSRPWTPLNSLVIGILPLIIGLSFLLTREISFSLWAFYLLGKAEAVFGAAVGLDGLRTATSPDAFPFASLQTTGAYIGLAAVSIWVARKGLGDMLRSRLAGGRLASAGADAGLPRQWYTYGGAIGFILLVAFCVAAGMPVGPALVMLVLSFIYLLAMTRLVAEAGMPWCAEPDFRGHHWVLALFPSSALRAPQVVATGMMLTFSHDLRIAPMPRLMQSFKMTDVTGTRNRDLVAACGLTLLIALPVSLWALMRASYLHGGVAINEYRFISLARQPGLLMEKATNTPRAFVDVATLGVVAYGAAKLLALNVLRTYYLWWPLHPVGYAMSFVTYLHREWCSVLIGWALQTLIIRYGGHKGYQVARPLFVGLILGAMVAGGFWLVLDGFTGLRDHKILY
ncbi:hypothetical protein LLH23_09130 [bacterium]|nr:hypothetical protein [bacterium]